VLMAVGSFTHGFDENQRYIPLTVDELSNHQLALHAPATASIAPPGDYMLFVVSADGVPSRGVHVRVVASATPLCRVTFTVNGPTDLTTFGQDVRVTGALDELGRWSGAEGIKLSGAQFPRWQNTAFLPQGATIQYKAVVFDPANGRVRFESGADRSATIPSGPGCSIDLVQDFRR
jgi:starch binding protein with CBM20 domain/galactose oxidase-like protein